VSDVRRDRSAAPFRRDTSGASVAEGAPQSVTCPLGLWFAIHLLGAVEQVCTGQQQQQQQPCTIGQLFERVHGRFLCFVFYSNEAGGDSTLGLSTMLWLHNAIMIAIRYRVGISCMLAECGEMTLRCYS